MLNLPFGLDAWYPLTIGALRNPRVLGHGTPVDAQTVKAAWDSCEPGQALILVDAIKGSLRQGLVRRAGHRSLAAQFERVCGTGGLARRWRLMPGTGGSHVLLPAVPGGFAAGMPMLPAGRHRSRLARALLRVAFSLGFGNRLGFGELLVAVKGLKYSIPTCEWLAQRPEAIVAISLGVPGYLRKATLRICSAAGRVEGFLKVSMGEAACQRIEHEADTLEQIELTAFGGGSSPRLLGRGTGQGKAWLVQSPLKGTRSANEITMAHVSFLGQLACKSRVMVPASELGVLLQAQERLNIMAGQVDGAWLETMGGLHATLSSVLSSRQIPCGLSHGDFTPWNLAVDQGTVAAFDWEFADWQAPALADLVHFHLQTGILVRRADPAILLEELEELALGSAHHLMAQRGLLPQDALAFIGLEVLRAATADEFINQIERPAFEQVQWLRDAREELARMIESRLAATAMGIPSRGAAA